MGDKDDSASHSGSEIKDIIKMYKTRLKAGCFMIQFYTYLFYLYLHMLIHFVCCFKQLTSLYL